jgi:hypothetical protein
MVWQIFSLMEGRPLSLVSLGKCSTMRSLMGCGMFIGGLFVRLMYRALHKMHEAALYGGPSMLWRTLVNTFSKRLTPGVRLY